MGGMKILLLCLGIALTLAVILPAAAQYDYSNDQNDYINDRFDNPYRDYGRDQRGIDALKTYEKDIKPYEPFKDRKPTYYNEDEVKQDRKAPKSYYTKGPELRVRPKGRVKTSGEIMSDMMTKTID